MSSSSMEDKTLTPNSKDKQAEEKILTPNSKDKQAEEKTLTLKSNDDQIFIVKESIAIQSITIKCMVDDGCASDTIPISNVDSITLALILEYLKVHGDPTISDENKEKFDAEFVNKPFEELIALLSAANYLDTKCLLNLLLDTIAGLMNNMSIEEIRKAFDVENDFTSDEEAELRSKYDWKFE